MPKQKILKLLKEKLETDGLLGGILASYLLITIPLFL